MIDERFERNVIGVKRCPSCNSDNIGYKVIGYPPNNLIIRFSCLDCGAAQSLPHAENLKRRNNTSLNHWRERVVKNDGAFCRLCHAEENLEVHHLIPMMADSNKQYALNDGNGIVLCKRCHNLLHHVWGFVPRDIVSTFQEET